MKAIKKILAVLLVGALFSVAMIGCHTVKGAGKDIESGGRTVERAAEGARPSDR